MACDVPNFDGKIDSVDYKSLPLLGHGTTMSQYVNKTKLVNEEECEVKVLRPGGYNGDNPRELIQWMVPNNRAAHLDGQCQSACVAHEQRTHKHS